MLKAIFAGSRRMIISIALCAAFLVPAITPKPAQAWWGPGWGWHARWGWHGGIVVGLPPVVVGAPVYAPPPYPYYAPGYAFARPYWHWVPEYREANGVVVAGHWEH